LGFAVAGFVEGSFVLAMIGLIFVDEVGLLGWALVAGGAFLGAGLAL